MLRQLPLSFTLRVNLEVQLEAVLNRDGAAEDGEGRYAEIGLIEGEPSRRADLLLVFSVPAPGLPACA